VGGMKRKILNTNIEIRNKFKIRTLKLRSTTNFLTIAGLVFSSMLVGCASQQPDVETPPASRLESIPTGIIKQSPEIDQLPPILHSDEFQQPVPLGDGINTAGAEDSAFVTTDGNTLYFFFTPDGTIPAERQLNDGVTGIWVSRKVGGEWQPAERVVLQKSGDLALDGCAFVQGNQIWFCTARQGNYDDIDMWISDYKNGKWTDFRNAGRLLNQDYEMGEMHITADGNEIYFHSGCEGGKGGFDIWVTRKANGTWQTPENIEIVNTTETEGWPFVTQDGNQLWLTRWYKGSPAIFRSKKINGQWTEPELIISQFAGEASLDKDGNLYFTHHFYWDNKMLEADIYVGRAK
jgi:hypothetical protein